MNALALFQEAFMASLWRSDADIAQPALAIYRNTAMRGCLDALEAGFPSVVCLVGRAWFRAAAAVYVEQAPPRDTRMVLYGHDFADFLGEFEHADGLSYLADVARLDRLCTEAYVAADAEHLTLSMLAAQTPDRLATTRFRIHPATRWHASPWPAFSIGSASRRGMPVDSDLAWDAESTLVVRLDGQVERHRIEPTAYRLLEACAEGHTLGEALVRAGAPPTGHSLDRLLLGLIRSGAFATS